MTCGPKIAAAVVFAVILTAYVGGGYLLRWLGRSR